MASWSGVLALSGFSFDARRKHIGFAPRVRDGLSFRSVWSNGQAWGLVTLEENSLSLRLLGGATKLASLGLPLARGPARLRLNDAEITAELRDGELRFATLELKTGDVLRVGAAGLSVEDLPNAAEL